jgi:hypothetical protein
VSGSLSNQEVDRSSDTVLNASSVKKNEHRWQNSVDDRIRGILEEAARGLEWAWKLDRQSPNSYPMNTGYLFAEIREHLVGESKTRSHIQLPPPTPPPKSLSELVSDKIIAAVYEDQNDGSYKEALKKAAIDFEEGPKAWRRILHAADAAYSIEHYGLEAIPKPRVHFLHRNLLELTELMGVNDLKPDGLLEFFEDMCPCREKHTTDAIRKLAKRRARTRKKRP